MVLAIPCMLSCMYTHTQTFSQRESGKQLCKYKQEYKSMVKNWRSVSRIFNPHLTNLCNIVHLASVLHIQQHITLSFPQILQAFLQNISQQAFVIKNYFRGTCVAWLVKHVPSVQVVIMGVLGLSSMSEFLLSGDLLLPLSLPPPLMLALALSCVGSRSQ